MECPGRSKSGRRFWTCSKLEVLWLVTRAFMSPTKYVPEPRSRQTTMNSYKAFLRAQGKSYRDGSESWAFELVHVRVMFKLFKPP